MAPSATVVEELVALITPWQCLRGTVSTARNG
jgi:hypothetical protein